MNKKQLVFTIIFCLFLSIYYSNLFSDTVTQFYDACAYNYKTVSLVQQFLFSALSAEFGGKFGFGRLKSSLCIGALQTVTQDGEWKWPWKLFGKRTNP